MPGLSCALTTHVDEQRRRYLLATTGFFVLCRSALELRLHLRRSNGARHDRAIGEDQRRRRLYAKLLTQCMCLFERVVALARVVGKHATREERIPRLHAVGGTPDDLRLARRVRVQLVDREKEGVDRDVVDRLELGFELGTKRTVGVRKHDELALAIALDPFEREIKRQAGDINAVQLAQSLLGQVDLAIDIVDRPDEDVFRLGVGIDQLVVELHLEEAQIRTARNHADRRPLELLFERLADECGLRRDSRNGVCGCRCPDGHRGPGKRQRRDRNSGGVTHPDQEKRGGNHLNSNNKS